MVNCISLPEEYGQIEEEIKKVVKAEFNRNSKEIECISNGIKETKNLSQLNYYFSDLKLLRENMVFGVLSKLEDLIYKKGTNIYHKIIPFGKVRNLVMGFIEHEIDNLLNGLSYLNKALINAINIIAKDLGAKEFAVTIGMPLTLTVTLNYNVKK